jgi:hypothetical protein
MAFPAYPQDGDTYTSPNGTTYQYHASEDFWQTIGNLGPTGPSGPEGPSGPTGPYLYAPALKYYQAQMFF